MKKRHENIHRSFSAIIMKIYSHIENNEEFKRFLIPKSSSLDNDIFADISIDYSRQKFVGYKRRIKKINEIEWKVYDGGTFPSSLFNEFLNSPPFNVKKWDYIEGWEEKGEITPELLVKWAYVENGYFSDQDEDLLMCRWDLIRTMHNLMIDEYSKRKEDLYKILKSYSITVFSEKKDYKAIEEFKKLKRLDFNNDYHLNLIKHLDEIENKKS